MALPFFYSDTLSTTNKHFVLNEDTSKHVVQVLRMTNGEQLQLTDGRGNLFTAEITDNNRKRCAVDIISQSSQPRSSRQVTLAVSLVKNSSRFEWLLEKVTEMGINAIVPLVCARTEKQHFREERMQGILISAMLQSQQSWLPVLHPATRFNDLVQRHTASRKFIAHCKDENDKVQLADCDRGGKDHSIILIGPEGDFTDTEITLALQQGYQPVALGNTRLRTETAGLVSAVLLLQ